MKKVGLKEKRKTRSLKRKIFGGMFFCLLVAAGYFWVFSPVLWIKKIEIKGTEIVAVREIKEVIEKNLAEKKWLVVPQKNIFLASAGKIEKDILAEFPEIKKASVNKKLPDILITEIKEREEIGIWCEQKKIIQKLEDKEEEILDSRVMAENDTKYREEKETIIEKCFYIDSEGVIFRQAPSMSGSLVLKIFDQKKQNSQIGERPVAPEIIGFVRQVKSGLDKLLELKILDFEVVSAGDIRARISQGWRIEFSPFYPAETQIETLKAVLENKIKENRASLEYIDLRTEGRVYYR